MANDKPAKVSKKARKQAKGPEWFDPKKAPEPGAVWHEPFSYNSGGGSVVKVRGHWERHEPNDSKPRRSE